MEEDGLGLEDRLVNQVLLPINGFQLDIAHAAIDEWSEVVRGIIIGYRSVGGGGARWNDGGFQVVFVHRKVLVAWVSFVVVACCCMSR